MQSKSKTKKAKKDNNAFISVEKITKRFGGVTALKNVSLSINRGEVHAIVGENGAGKSTLMKILSGIYKPDDGKIFIDGSEVLIYSPKDAESHGIAMVFQELNLFPPLTVAANIFIRKEPKLGRVLLDEPEMVLRSKEILSRLKVDINPRREIEFLTTGQKQIVEIARAVLHSRKIVIMDEPNSALNNEETKALFSIIRYLTKDGITVIYVSHRLEEVFSISDRISVLRDGVFQGTWSVEDTTIDEIVSKVVGRRIEEIFPKKHKLIEEPETSLSVKGLEIGSNNDKVQFYARKGEVLGLAGLAGSGVDDVLKKLFGLIKSKNAEILFDGEKIDRLMPKRLIQDGWAFIPADRREEGLMLEWPIKKNISLVSLTKFLTRYGFIKHKKENELTNEYIEKFSIATSSDDKIVRDLSGGNQQKVVLAKWISSNPTLLILNDPTRGIDVGTKHDIYLLIKSWAEQRYTIIFTSSEIEEIIGVSDQILVFYRNKIVKSFPRMKLKDKELIMKYVLSGDIKDNKIS